MIKKLIALWRKKRAKRAVVVFPAMEDYAPSGKDEIDCIFERLGGNQNEQ